jgi:predicted chitinase
MIISPPFLPARAAGQSDESWLDAAMRPTAARLPDTHAAEGSFPLSHSLCWHNGVHIQAPTDDGGNLPVRAIADGIVRFVHAPRRPNAIADDAQNYNPFDRGGSAAPTPAWTDNGCVIVEHTTAIGAAAAHTAVVFYSLYMHLGEIGRRYSPGQAGGPWAPGDHIWRKDAVGTAGQIYGHRGQIHFEVCLNAANLQALIGRAPAWVAPAAVPTTDGRIDSIFGSLYFYLPASTPTVASNALPTSHLRRAVGGTTLQSAVWVKMTYHQGGCRFETFDQHGTAIHALATQAEEEYDLYQEAIDRHGALPAAERAHSSPSAWYELLRFGRNIGRGPGNHDPLPADVAHWRRIAGPGRAPVWADLNAPGTFKFSDADFPAIMNWNFYDDDSNPANQICESNHLKEAIRDSDPANAQRMLPAQLATRLGRAEVQGKLRRAVCRFNTEWARDTVVERYKFAEELIRESSDDNEQAVARLHAHVTAMTFDNLPAGYVAADWRLHPREFLLHLRQCGWLSDSEMVQCMPRNSPAGLVPLATARARIGTWGVGINRMTRKFSLDDRLRLTHILAQVWAETGYLRLTREAGADGARYAPYIGRGLIQITWQDKYENYNEFARITPNGGSNFNLELIATDQYHAGNSSGFYWVSKDFKEPRDTVHVNLSRLADEGDETDSIGKLCLWINGGGNHYDHRHSHFYFIDGVLNDVPREPASRFPTVETRTFMRMEFIRETRTVNGHHVRVIVGTRRSATPLSITIDHTPQR